MILKIKKAFWRFLITYLFIVVIFIAIGLIFLFNITDVLRREATTQMVQKLEGAKDLVDSKLDSIYDIQFSVAMDFDTTTFVNMNTPLDNREYFLISQMRKKYPAKYYPFNDDFIYDIYLYNYEADLLISSNMATARTGFFYDAILKYDEYGYSEFKDLLKSNYYHQKILPSSTIAIDGVKNEFIPIVQSLPIGSYGTSKGVIFTLVYLDNLMQYFSSIKAEGSWFYVMDADDQFLFSNNIESKKIPKNIEIKEYDYSVRDIDGVKYLLVKIVSESSGLQYVAAIKNEHITDSLQDIVNTFYILFGVIVFFGFLISLFFAYYNQLPFKRIKLLFDKNSEINKHNESEFDYIEHSIKKVLDENKIYKDNLTSYIPLVKHAALSKLFNGNYISKDDIPKVLDVPNCESKFFQVIVATLLRDNSKLTGIATNENSHVLSIVLLKNIDDNIAGEKYLYPLDDNRIAILKVWNNEIDIEYKVNIFCEDIINSCTQKYNAKLFFGCSSLYTEIVKTSFAYSEALKASEYHVISDKRVIWNKDTYGRNEGALISIDEEINLVNNVKAGNTNELKQLLNAFTNIHFGEHNISVEGVKRLKSQITILINRIIDSLTGLSDADMDKLEIMESALMSYNNLNELSSAFNDIVIFLAKWHEERKNSHHDLLKIQIEDFINENYTNTELSVNMISEHLDISRNYVYHFFKEQFGQNYTSYVENLRLKNSVQLMGTTNYTIKEIAKQSGYDNINTYYKAFKRKFAESPKAYRSKLSH